MAFVSRIAKFIPSESGTLFTIVNAYLLKSVDDLPADKRIGLQSPIFLKISLLRWSILVLGLCFIANLALLNCLFDKQFASAPYKGELKKKHITASSIAFHHLGIFDPVTDLHGSVVGLPPSATASVIRRMNTTKASVREKSLRWIIVSPFRSAAPGVQFWELAFASITGGVIFQQLIKKTPMSRIARNGVYRYRDRDLRRHQTTNPNQPQNSAKRPSAEGYAIGKPRLCNR